MDHTITINIAKDGTVDVSKRWNDPTRSLTQPIPTNVGFVESVNAIGHMMLGLFTRAVDNKLDFRISYYPKDAPSIAWDVSLGRWHANGSTPRDAVEQLVKRLEENDQALENRIGPQVPNPIGGMGR